jgi:hypothetical protein
MAVFFIDTSDGQVATKRQLIEAGIASAMHDPPRPWLRIQGTNDASTMWYAVLRKQERGIWLGALAMRHQGHFERLTSSGWEEVPIEEIGARSGSSDVADRAIQGSEDQAGRRGRGRT